MNNRRLLSRPLGRCIGLHVHLEYCEIAICDEGKVYSAGRVPPTPEGIYMCAHCGATAIYQLVPNVAGETHQPASIAPSEIPSIDFRCSRCGARQTYMLVPDSVRDQPE